LPSGKKIGREAFRAAVKPKGNRRWSARKWECWPE